MRKILASLLATAMLFGVIAGSSAMPDKKAKPKTATKKVMKAKATKKVAKKATTKKKAMTGKMAPKKSK